MVDITRSQMTLMVKKIIDWYCILCVFNVIFTVVTLHLANVLTSFKKCWRFVIFHHMSKMLDSRMLVFVNIVILFKRIHSTELLQNFRVNYRSYKLLIKTINSFFWYVTICVHYSYILLALEKMSHQNHEGWTY